MALFVSTKALIKNLTLYCGTLLPPSLRPFLLDFNCMNTLSLILLLMNLFMTMFEMIIR
jgi:hypothetical protein